MAPLTYVSALKARIDRAHATHTKIVNIHELWMRQNSRAAIWCVDEQQTQTCVLPAEYATKENVNDEEKFIYTTYMRTYVSDFLECENQRNYICGRATTTRAHKPNFKIIYRKNTISSARAHPVRAFYLIRSHACSACAQITFFPFFFGRSFIWLSKNAVTKYIGKIEETFLR